jgi:hypothetical protein
MNTEEIINTIKSLPIKVGTDANNTKINEVIHQTAETITERMNELGLHLVTGGSSPTSQKSYARLYLEPISNTTHNPRHKAYDVKRTWEWQTHSKYGFAPISHKSIIQMCNELINIVGKQLA